MSLAPELPQPDETAAREPAFMAPHRILVIGTSAVGLAALQTLLSARRARSERLALPTKQAIRLRPQPRR